jgi:hypothetical protein
MRTRRLKPTLFSIPNPKPQRASARKLSGMAHRGNDLDPHTLHVSCVRARRLLVSQLPYQRRGVIVLAGLDHAGRPRRVRVRGADQDRFRSDAAAFVNRLADVLDQAPGNH